MIELRIPSISCDHCVRAVTEAVHEVDRQAQVEVDLAGHMVTVDSRADRQSIVQALADAGYTPE